MKRRTVTQDDLETMARAAHADIELPGPEGGWAVAVINGREYRAAVAPAAVPIDDPADVRLRHIAMGEES